MRTNKILILFGGSIAVAFCLLFTRPATADVPPFHNMDVPQPHNMVSTHIYMIVGGSNFIMGDVLDDTSTYRKYSGSINLDKVTFGESNGATIPAPGERIMTSGNTYTTVSIQKAIDKATPYLMSAVNQHQVLDPVEIDFVDQADEMIFQYVMNNVIVKSDNLTSQNAFPTTENIELAFTTLTMTVNRTGTPLKAFVADPANGK